MSYRKALDDVTCVSTQKRCVVRILCICALTDCTAQGGNVYYDDVVIG